MKNKILFFFFLLLPVFLFSQNKREYLKYTRNHFKHIEWNGKQYSNSPRGAWLLLKDIESVDSQLFKILEPDFKRYNKNMATGLISGITGATACSGFLFAAFLENLKRSFEPSRKSNTYLILGGASLVIGVVVGTRVAPNKRIFIYNFTQKINENSQKIKAQFTIHPDIQLGNNSSVGLAFSLSF